MISRRETEKQVVWAASPLKEQEPSSHRPDKLSHATRATSGGQHAPCRSQIGGGCLVIRNSRQPPIARHPGRTWRNLGNAPRALETEPNGLESSRGFDLKYGRSFPVLPRLGQTHLYLPLGFGAGRGEGMPASKRPLQR